MLADIGLGTSDWKQFASICKGTPYCITLKILV